MARRMIAIENGEKPDFRYEVWTNREHRLEGGEHIIIAPPDCNDFFNP
ncbi:MAG TPA: hypothetical protein VGK14_08830 [Novimethylophilus sp.]|jgi:hypothetical protein